MKVVTTEVLIAQQINIPAITETYDLMSKRNDGTITSQGPVIVSGRNLLIFGQEKVCLCLSAATDCNLRIEIHDVYKYSNVRIIISLPALIPGEYFLSVKTVTKGEEESLYIFPASWIVPYEDCTIQESYPCCATIEEIR